MITGKENALFSVIFAVFFLSVIAAPGCNGSTVGDEDGDQDVDTDAEDAESDVTADETAGDPDADDPAGDDAIDDPAADDGEMPTAQYWVKSYGGWEDDVPYSILRTSDGGFIVAGDTESYGAGSSDFWIVKLDEHGNIQWDRAYGGSGLEEARSILEAPGGGYVIAGKTESFGVGGDGAFWVLKLNGGGDVEWQKMYEGGGGVSIAPAHGGGYVVAGGTTAFGAGGSDVWVIKINDGGGVQWQYSYGGSDHDVPFCIRQSGDGGYVFAGWTSSFGAGWADFWVTKLDGDGNVTWSKAFGGVDGDQARFVEPTGDNGYIVSGWTVSFGAGNSDMWILKLDSGGNIEWQNTYGGGADDRGFSIARTSDGGYITAGRTESFGAGNADIWILRLDSAGLVQWQETVGSTYDEDARSALELPGGDFVVTGKDSYYGTAAHDFWVLKMDSDGVVSTDCPAGMIGNSSASATASSVTPADVTVTPAATTATASDTSITPVDTSTDSETQCSR